jgi:crotonobetainyl-CoA:carnitine CoA-transferase CaiB-like acyl-CoA transferase
MALRSLARAGRAAECVADGLRVLELGSGLGAVAALILADNGAVIKVEPPGDPLRSHPAFRMWSRKQRWSRISRQRAAGSRRGPGRRADVDLELAGGVDARFGLDPSASPRATRAPSCPHHGFGSRGPYATTPPGTDRTPRPGACSSFAAQAGAATYRRSRWPAGARPPAHGILAALLDRERTGRGRRVETSLVQALGVYDLVNWLPGYTMMLRTADVPYLPSTNACTKDGVWLQFAQLSPVQFRAFIRDLGLDEIWADPRFFAPRCATGADAALRAILLARLHGRPTRNGCASSTPIPTSRSAASGGRGDGPPQIRHNGDVIEREIPRSAAARAGAAGPLLGHAVPPRRRGRAGSRPPPGRRGSGGRGAREPRPAAPSAGRLLVLELPPGSRPRWPPRCSPSWARVIKIEPIGGEPFRQVKHGVPWLKTVQASRASRWT